MKITSSTEWKRFTVLLTMALALPFGWLSVAYSSPVSVDFPDAGDTFIAQYHATTYYGDSPLLTAYGTAPYYKQDTPLIRFDLSSIPANATLLSAQISVTPIEMENPAGDEMGVWDLATDFVDSQANYTVASSSVPWNTPGLAQYVDYDKLLFNARVHVVQGQTVSFDSLPLVKQIRAAGSNILDLAVTTQGGGISLASKEYTDATKAPTLHLVYSMTAPQVKVPDGIFLTLAQWNQLPISVDGSGSILPGGSTTGLTYSWTLDQPAYGSALTSGAGLGNSAILSFNPDVAGGYTVRLTVTNSATGEATFATCRVVVGLKGQHPRLEIDNDVMARMLAHKASNDQTWQNFMQIMNEPAASLYTDALAGIVPSEALATLLTGDVKYFNDAWSRIAKYIYVNQVDNSGGLQTILALSNNDSHAAASNIQAAIFAIFYDWAYGYLNATQKQDLISWLNATNTFNHLHNGSSNSYLRNDGVAVTYGIAATAMATWEDNPQAAQTYGWFLDRWSQVTQGLDIQGRGGALSEGTGYGDADTGALLIHTANVVYTASGNDLFKSHPYFLNHLMFDAFATFPALADPTAVNPAFTPAAGYQPALEIASIGGDGAHGYGWTDINARSNGLILSRHFSGTPEANAWNWVYRQPELDFEHQWYNSGADLVYGFPNPPLTKPSVLSYHDPSMGYVFIRSDWDSRDATWIGLWAGPHLDTHQHLDQGGFAIFKHRDLSPKTGNYADSTPGTPHGDGYYERTISSNGLLIGDPHESFMGFNGWTGCDSNGNIFGGHNVPLTSGPQVCITNDGGQRTMNPYALFTPDSYSYHSGQSSFDVAKIVSFDDNGQTVRVVADITNAYNNPQHTTFGNSPKVNKVYRRFVYVRNLDTLVVADTVESTNPSFTKRSLLHALDQLQVGGDVTTVSPGEELHRRTNQAAIVVDDTQPSVQGQTTVDMRKGFASLLVETLFPNNFVYRKVGGRVPSSSPDAYGHYTTHLKDFWVQDFSAGVVPNHTSANWSVDFSKDESATSVNADYAGGYGRWRLEIEPTVPAVTDYFLNVLKPSLTKGAKMPAMTKIETPKSFGVSLLSGSSPLYIMFPKDTLNAPTVSNQPPADSQAFVPSLQVKVYPNPWRADKHADKKITFVGSTSETEIKIFTVSGHEVKELRSDSSTVTWDLTNDTGEKVASGLYLYVASDSNDSKAKGTFAVIR